MKLWCCIYSPDQSDRWAARRKTVFREQLKENRRKRFDEQKAVCLQNRAANLGNQLQVKKYLPIFVNPLSEVREGNPARVEKLPPQFRDCKWVKREIFSGSSSARRLMWVNWVRLCKVAHGNFVATISRDWRLVRASRVPSLIGTGPLKWTRFVKFERESETLSCPVDILRLVKFVNSRRLVTRRSLRCNAFKFVYPLRPIRRVLEARISRDSRKEKSSKVIVDGISSTERDLRLVVTSKWRDVFSPKESSSRLVQLLKLASKASVVSLPTAPTGKSNLSFLVLENLVKKDGEVSAISESSLIQYPLQRL